MLDRIVRKSQVGFPFIVARLTSGYKWPAIGL
jgi:hypothetical protein